MMWILYVCIVNTYRTEKKSNLIRKQLLRLAIALTKRETRMHDVVKLIELYQL